MRTFPTLYKKTSTGAIEQWQIASFDNTIQTIHGQRGGKLQTTTDTIKSGKNLGKANATTAEQQAELEATARWTKQKERKGYVESVERAEAGETDQEGGIVPMLAHKFNEQGHKIKYPCYTQPKLDGSRCIAIVLHGKCTLWSRTRKQIHSMPHIVRALEEALPNGNVVLDGELYNHAYHNNFEQLMSFIRSDEPKEGCEVVQYHVYDLPGDGPFSEREQVLHAVLSNAKEPIVIVETLVAEDEEGLMTCFDIFRSQGYEGAMARNAAGPYENKRSYNLQKIKEFDDGEWKIVGIEEGRGKLQGHVGSFICETKDGVKFNAKAKGEVSRLRDYFLDHSLWQGKLLTVQYQGMTNKSNVPRFPIGLRIREAE